MLLRPLLSLCPLAVLPFALACGGDHSHHSHEKRLPPSSKLPVPTRPLVWGDLNILHTTDSHGWLLGHQKHSFPEPNYSGDLGDFASFVARMKELSLIKGVDLLLVDSGDLHDGTGLSDGFPPGGVDAHESNKFIAKLPYDVMAIGNHELYIYNNTLDMHKNFAPELKGRYLSSNVNITLVEKGETVNVPVGERFTKFRTRRGKKITAFGVLFDFTGNDKNTTVQKVADMVKESWFTEVIQDEPDVFLLAGHMPVARDNWPLVFNAIRAVHPLTPIIILGGHTHIRDCVQLDGRSMSLESGRYMETVGWLSVDLEHKNTNRNLTFSRRYLDPNRVTYEYHTKHSNFTFDTFQGKSITRGLLELSKSFSLDSEFGVAPRDYYISQAAYPSDASALSLFAAEAMPFALSINNSRADIPSLMITNSGSLRFDLFAGSFTKNDQLTASPFADSFLYIPDVQAGIAKAVLDGLNKAGANERREIDPALGNDVLARRQEMVHGGEVFMRWLDEMAARQEIDRRATEANLTLGYVTKDSCPGVGDDILHAPLPFFSAPDFIASNIPSDITDDIPIDLVFVDFIESDVIAMLNNVQTEKTYSTADVAGLYSPVLSSAVLGLYAEGNWN